MFDFGKVAAENSLIHRHPLPQGSMGGFRAKPVSVTKWMGTCANGEDHIMDYSAFDSFLNVDTWHTGHHYDLQRFYQALHRVISNPEFDPEAMGQYMRHKKNVAPSDHESAFPVHIRDLVQNAWAVKEYLKANGSSD